jgi:hypothetical protein
MPKKMSRNKRGRSTMRTTAGPRTSRVHSVKDLLSRSIGNLTSVTDRQARQGFWSEWLSLRLAAELPARISAVTEREGKLVIYSDTAAWSARLRYAILELEADIRAQDPAITQIVVRVKPRR